MNQTQQRGICSRINDRRIWIFGHVSLRRLRKSVPAHEALKLAVDVGLAADSAWDMPVIVKSGVRMQRPIGGQAVQ